MNFFDAIQRGDDAATVFLNVRMGSEIGDWIMIFITHLGNGLVAAALVALALYLGRDTGGKNFWRNFLWAMAALLAAGATAQLIKFFFNRPRPLGGISNLPQLRDILRADMHWRSFPSGHSATAFAAAAYLAAKIKKLSPVFYCIAALIAVSRVYTGVHFPTDVMAGALLGALASKMILEIRSRRGI
ncbi:MAG: phosphatase PAP2 family protein [Endomicrobiia bacterium]|nr:phosphatase PAP2 family protein [Endomicrobiia bacterium]